MKKITLLFVLMLYVVSAFGAANGPALCGIGWIAWHTKDDFGATPYENKQYTVYKAPATWNPVASVAEFDATWDLLGEANHVALPTNTAGGDLFDLGTGNTFGATWKAVHDGSKMYVLLKYYDIDEQVDQASLAFEIMAQPTSPVRHEPSFEAASDSAENFVKVYKNQAYARMVELGGGKAVFANGAAAQYEAARGTHRALHPGQQYWRSNQWVNNEFGLMALLDLADEGLMFWEKADGVIRAVFPMDFAGVLSYPEDPAGDIVDGPRIALKEGDTFAFDVKSNALKGDAKVEYFWSANNNDGYGANYYSGHVTISPNVIGETPGTDIALCGIGWIAWHTKDDFGATPYDNKKYTVYKAPATWNPVASVAEFDATWDLLGEANQVALPTNTAGGDLFDLGTGNTFGAAWKAVHDGSRMYVLLKYYDIDEQVDQASLAFEIMAQPTSPVRHEPSYNAASDSAENFVKVYKNQAYARMVELGGGKAVFTNGAAAQYEAARGTHRALHPGQQYWRSNQWVNNEFALMALLDMADEGLMFWEKADGVIRAVFPMDFAGVLSYPEDPAGDIVDGPRIALKEGDTFAFDVKSNALNGDAKVEYFWSANHNDGYGANYYSGHLTISDEVVAGETPGALTVTGINWIAWHNKDDWGTTPYDNKTYTVKKAPATWSPVSDNAAFDATWNLLGEQNNVAFPTNVAGGDLFDLGAGNTFGSAWKAVHDGEIMYVLLKYHDVDQQVDQTSLSFEIMAQPTSPVRHEPTFQAGKDSTENAKAYQNQAYARVVELGGGKALFKDGVAAAYEAAKGTHRVFGPAWAGEYWQSGQWVNNEFAVLAMLDLIDDGKMYWDITDGVIRAVFAMDFAGVLSYPADPAGDIMDGPRVSLKVGDTFAFDVKSNAAKGDAKIEYFWSANNNDGYGANYYSGHLTISPQVVVDATNVRDIAPGNRLSVYIFDQVLHVIGDQPVDLEIYNLLGAKLKSAQNINQLPVSDLNNGIYIVRINGGRNAYKVVKY